MRKPELPELSSRLAQLADALGGRAPSTAGLAVWLDVLGECAMPDVLAVLVDWPKKQSRMPLPAEVLKACRERVSARVEAESERNRRTAPTIADVMARTPRNLSPEAKQARREIAALVSAPPRVDRKAWARRLKLRERAGEELTDLQRRMWRDALGHDDSQRQETDDFEARAEREAIQAEAFT